MGLRVVSSLMLCCFLTHQGDKIRKIFMGRGGVTVLVVLVVLLTSVIRGRGSNGGMLRGYTCKKKER